MIKPALQTMYGFPVLAINLLASGLVHDDQSYAWWRSDGPAILQHVNEPSYRINEWRKQQLTLSPKPHILARRGCCTTFSLDRFVISVMEMAEEL